MAPPPKQPARPANRRFLADEMSTSRGKRLVMQQALGSGAPQVGPPEVKKPLLVQQLETLMQNGALPHLSRFLLSKGLELERTARTDFSAGRALLRAWEALAAEPAYAEQVLSWAGRAGRDAALVTALGSGSAVEATCERVMTNIIGRAVPNLRRSLEARFATSKTAAARVTATVDRLFRPFDAKSAFAAAAQLKP